MFTGEPGIGKTRLLERFAEDAVAAGRHVIRGRCFEAEMVRPYGLWLDALRGLPTEGIAEETLAQATPLLAGQATEGGDRERLFESAAVLLRSLAARRPLALLLDDLQWIDEGSAALLHFLSRTLGAATAIVFAGAARVGEVHDNRFARSLLQSLVRDGGVRRFNLAPLSPTDARALIGDTHLDDDNDAVAHHRETAATVAL